jgi:hypothetical protein
MSAVKRGFFEKTRNKVRRMKEEERRVIVIEDDDNDDDNEDDDDATVPLESNEPVAEERQFDGNLHLNCVPWRHVIPYLTIANVALLGATCRLLFDRVRAEVRDIDIRALSPTSLAYGVAKFANQCTNLHSFVCRLTQVGFLPTAVRPHKLDIVIDMICMMPPSGVAWSEIKEMTISEGHSPIYWPALSFIFYMCATSLTRLEVTAAAFALKRLPLLPNVEHLALPIYTRPVEKWAQIWEHVPALRSLVVAQAVLPVKQLPPQLRSLAVSPDIVVRKTFEPPLEHLLAALASQSSRLQEQCPQLYSLELSLTVRQPEAAAAIVLQVLNATSLPHLEHLEFRFRALRFEPSFTDADMAQIRSALAQCRARSSSLWHVVLSGAQRYCQRRVYDLSNR